VASAGIHKLVELEKGVVGAGASMGKQAAKSTRKLSASAAKKLRLGKPVQDALKKISGLIPGAAMQTLTALDPRAAVKVLKDFAPLALLEKAKGLAPERVMGLLGLHHSENEEMMLQERVPARNAPATPPGVPEALEASVTQEKTRKCSTLKKKPLPHP
jgi:hypothetical protein